MDLICRSAKSDTLVPNCVMAAAKGQGTKKGPFVVGFSEDENLKWRKSMEVPNNFDYLEFP